VDRRAKFVHADLGDRDAVFAAVEAAGAEAVIHFAANALVGESMTNPSKYFRNNVASGLEPHRRRGGRRVKSRLQLNLRDLRTARARAHGRVAAASGRSTPTASPS
jgi:dTDP-D-glucose 4,6-dehydratase